MPTELDDLRQPLALPAGVITMDRYARLFASNPLLAEKIMPECERVHLIPDELLHPAPPCDLVIRHGNLRVSELLTDGREVTRAVLQTGAVCRVRLEGPSDSGEASNSPLYTLGRTVLMALGETEVWRLPAGTLNTE